VGSYLYNAFEQRVQKVAGGVATQFVFDRSGHLLEEANGSGTVQRDYIWFDNVPVAMVDDTGTSPVSYYIHTDQLGTPQNMTDGSANIVWDNLSDPFGNGQATQGTNWGAANWGSFNWAVTMLSLSNLRFPGQYYDADCTTTCTATMIRSWGVISPAIRSAWRAESIPTSMSEEIL
jgi:hypothetical protein